MTVSASDAKSHVGQKRYIRFANGGATVHATVQSTGGKGDGEHVVIGEAADGSDHNAYTLSSIDYIGDEPPGPDDAPKAERRSAKKKGADGDEGDVELPQPVSTNERVVKGGPDAVGNDPDEQRRQREAETAERRARS